MLPGPTLLLLGRGLCRALALIQVANMNLLHSIMIRRSHSGPGVRIGVRARPGRIARGHSLVATRAELVVETLTRKLMSKLREQIFINLMAVS